MDNNRLEFLQEIARRSAAFQKSIDGQGFGRQRWSMLSEDQFVGIAQREERALLGDRSVTRQLIEEDVPRLLAYIRDLQRVEALLRRVVQGTIVLGEEE